MVRNNLASNEKALSHKARHWYLNFSTKSNKNQAVLKLKALQKAFKHK